MATTPPQSAAAIPANRPSADRYTCGRCPPRVGHPLQPSANGHRSDHCPPHLWEFTRSALLASCDVMKADALMNHAHLPQVSGTGKADAASPATLEQLPVLNPTSNAPRVRCREPLEVTVTAAVPGESYIRPFSVVENGDVPCPPPVSAGQCTRPGGRADSLSLVHRSTQPSHQPPTQVGRSLPSGQPTGSPGQLRWLSVGMQSVGAGGQTSKRRQPLYRCSDEPFPQGYQPTGSSCRLFVQRKPSSMCFQQTQPSSQSDQPPQWNQPLQHFSLCNQPAESPGQPFRSMQSFSQFHQLSAPSTSLHFTDLFSQEERLTHGCRQLLQLTLPDNHRDSFLRSDKRSQEVACGALALGERRADVQPRRETPTEEEKVPEPSGVSEGLSLAELPYLVLLEILSFLPLSDLVQRVRPTCRRLHSLSHDPWLWRTVEVVHVERFARSRGLLSALLRQPSFIEGRARAEGPEGVQSERLDLDLDLDPASGYATREGSGAGRRVADVVQKLTVNCQPPLAPVCYVSDTRRPRVTVEVTHGVRLDCGPGVACPRLREVTTDTLTFQPGLLDLVRAHPWLTRLSVTAVNRHKGLGPRVPEARLVDCFSAFQSLVHLKSFRFIFPVACRFVNSIESNGLYMHTEALFHVMGGFFASARGLEEVEVSDVNSNVLKTIVDSCHRLRSLSFGSHTLSTSAFHPEGVPQPRAQRALQSLAVSCSVTVIGEEHAANMAAAFPGLRSLNLTHSTVRQAALSLLLRRCPRLEAVHVDRALPNLPPRPRACQFSAGCLAPLLSPPSSSSPSSSSSSSSHPTASLPSSFPPRPCRLSSSPSPSLPCPTPSSPPACGPVAGSLREFSCRLGPDADGPFLARLFRHNLHLTRLRLSHCPSVTDSALAQLARVCPNLQHVELHQQASMVTALGVFTLLRLGASLTSVDVFSLSCKGRLVTVRPPDFEVWEREEDTAECRIDGEFADAERRAHLDLATQEGRRKQKDASDSTRGEPREVAKSAGKARQAREVTYAGKSSTREKDALDVSRYAKDVTKKTGVVRIASDAKRDAGGITKEACWKTKNAVETAEESGEITEDTSEDSHGALPPLAPKEAARGERGVHHLGLGRVPRMSGLDVLILLCPYADRLTSLSLHGCAALGDDAVDIILRTCPRLESLTLDRQARAVTSGTCGLTDVTLQLVSARGRGLRELHTTHGHRFTPHGLATLLVTSRALQTLTLTVGRQHAVKRFEDVDKAVREMTPRHAARVAFRFYTDRSDRYPWTKKVHVTRC